jgi:predicted flap endonuclease-1-like 5' DNA nuclease
MWYLVGEIVVWLLAALVFGLLIGWLMRSAAARRDVTAEKTRFLDTLERQEEELTAARQHLAQRDGRVEELQRGIEQRQATIADLEQQLSTKSVAVKGLEAARNALKDNLAERDHARERETERVGNLESELERLRQDLANSDREVSGLRSQLQDLEGLTQQVTEREALIRELEPARDRLEEAQRELAELSEQHRSVVGEKDGEIQRLRRRIEELEPLSGRVTELERHVVELEPLAQQLTERDREITRLRREYRGLERAAKRPPPKIREAPTPPRSAKDDLKQIKGIGPAIERLLNRLGYRTFRDIAGWGEEEIQRVTGHLGAFAGRVRRDRWVQQAKRLHQRKYGEKL